MTSWHERLLPAPSVALGAAASLAGIATLDALTGHEVHLSFLYFVPVALVAVYGSPVLAWAFCVAAASLWYVAELASGYTYAHPLIPVWNAIVRLLTLSVITLLLLRLREALRARAQLVEELRESLANVRTLSGLLPICAWCKNIRDDAGYWQRVESYVQARSTATFTHGICPACAAKVRAEMGLDEGDAIPEAAPRKSDP